MMAVRQRLHVPGGTYYVVQRGSCRQPVFSRPEDYALFERLFASALRRTGSRTHAYCWTPDGIRLALQIRGVPVSRFMQRLTSQYARMVQQRCGESGRFFRHGYRAILIDPDAYLLKLTHYIHHIPVQAGLSRTADDYPRSSHHAYLGLITVPWLTTQVAMRRLGHSSDEARRAYAQLMARAPAAEDARLFEQGNPDDPRVVADQDFLATLPRGARIYRSQTSLDQLINTVAISLGIEREHIASSSRQRELTFARALITWHATERGIATLAEVARRLRRDPSTLSSAVQRYKVHRPDLFRLSALPDVVPIGLGIAARSRSDAAVRGNVKLQ